MKNTILHISDLHFVAKYEREGNSKFDDSFKLRFIRDLEKGLVKNSLKIKYLIISGDVANEGEEREYKEALLFLNELQKKFKIKKENILICPGNHDITWDALRKKLDKLPEGKMKEAHTYHDVKFQCFKSFYSSFFEEEKEFSCNSAVVDKIIDNDAKLIIIGLNSCFKESFQKNDHIGFIEPISLSENVKELFSNEKYYDYDKLLVMHHNPEDFKNEEGSLSNWREISLILGNYFPTTICGHIHSSTGKGEVRTSGNKYYVSVGSFSKIGKNIKNAFNLIYLLDGKEHKYKVLFFEYEEPNAGEPYWQHHDAKENELNEVTLHNKQGEDVLKEIEVQPVFDIDKNIQDINYKNVLRQNQKNFYEKDQFEEYVNMLMGIIQEKKLFKTGHFHWSKNFRSHGIIDINHLISNKESIDLICHLFNLKFKQVFNGYLPDLIIGIGFEGNVIGARLSIIFPDCDYSFIPDNPKDKDFSIFEHEIKDGHYKNIVLIKDLLIKADSLKETVNKHIFADKNVCVFSLFYCGKEIESELFADYKNVKHYSICNKIKINLCQHNDNIENCTIIKHNLDIYYPLYST